MIYLKLLLGSLIGILAYFLYTFLKREKYQTKRAKFSSKIKPIYIELHNYSFFHSPEGIKKSYSRFVGREKLMDKLRAILTNSETKSGAYLITGFRGMGKTSLVRKTISEMKGNHYYAFYRHLRQFLLLLILSVVHRHLSQVLEFDSQISIFSFCLGCALISYLVYHDNNRPNIWKYYKSSSIFPHFIWCWECLKSVLRILDPEIDYFKRSKFKTLLQDVVIIAVLYLSVSFYYDNFYHEKLITKGFLKGFKSLFIVSLLYFAASYLFNNYQIERINDLSKPRIFSFLRGIRRIFENAIKRFDYGNKVPIEISLSQDDLKEIDILKLLAKNIHAEYRSLRNRIFAPNRIIGSFVTLIAIYLIVGATYYAPPLYSFVNDIRHRLGVVQYFPSQAMFPHLNEQSLTQPNKGFSQPLYYHGVTPTAYINHIDSLLFKKYSLEAKNEYVPSPALLYAVIDFETYLTNEYCQNNNNKDLLNYQMSYNFHVSLLKNVFSYEDRRDSSEEIRKVLLTLPDSVDQFKYELFKDELSNWKLDGYIRPLNNQLIRTCTIFIDYWLQVIYRRAFRQLIEREYKKRAYLSQDFRFPPVLLDYFFFLTILFFFLILNFFYRYSWRIGIISHRYILRRLSQLNDNIAAQITHDQQTGIGGGAFRQTLNFFSRRTKNYPIAGVREIENELIDILSEIDQISYLSSRPEFIFIFDELDKIEAHYNVSIVEKEGEELASFANSDEGYFSTESIRKRQETIARILGNLKLFFNTAKAKFIFITGREMYDASLADISDRDSFISSIFHEIIYVESFFKDAGNKGHNGVTGITEEFICQLLMPRFCPYNKDLNGYNQYLKDCFSIQYDPLFQLKQFINRISFINIYDLEWNENDEHVQQRKKIIYILNQFITFLTYRGNGAPKKITKLLEGYIEPSNESILIDNRILSFARNSNNLYLSFDYLTQYRIGLTHHLFNPYLLANRRHMRDYGDKILIATSFLIDHLYKFHDVGFSWENLELTPEIIAINKSPELRKFISRLIGFMANNHLEEVVNGLHQFKFTVRIAAEISYISTISEQESAAFNFTLDESLLLKRHYRKKLRYLDKVHQALITSNSNMLHKHIDSIAYINTILGDLHYYDREFDEALIHYMDASQSLLRLDTNLGASDFMFLIRLLLKLALTYEKMKDYDSSYITLGRIARLVRDTSRKYDSSLFVADNSGPEQMNKVKRKELKRIKYKVFENLRLIFQPLLAQFILIEKGGSNGITQVDLIRVKKEFKMIIKGLESKEKFLVEADFKNKLGDILFYKNGALWDKKWDKEKRETPFTREIDTDLFTTSRSSIENRDISLPLSALEEYLASLNVFSSKMYFLISKDSEKKINESSIVENVNIAAKFLLFPYKTTHSRYAIKQRDQLVNIGSNLSDLADSFICFMSVEKVDWKLIHRIFGKGFDQNNILDSICKITAVGCCISRPRGTKYNPFQWAVILLTLSSQFFLKAGDYNRYSFQLKKVLIIIKRTIEYSKKTEITDQEFKIILDLGNEILKIIDRTMNNTRRQSLYEAEGYFFSNSSGFPSEIKRSTEEKRMLYRESLEHLPEAKEVIILMNEIHLYHCEIDIIKSLKETIVGTPYSVINNKYNRIFELYYKCNLNFKLFNIILKKENISGNIMCQDNLSKLFKDLLRGASNESLLEPLGMKKDDLLIYLITDSLYCLSEVIRSFNIFGITYSCNHSLNGLAHEHFAWWCNYYQQLKKASYDDRQVRRFVKKMELTLGDLLGKVDLQYLDIGYHYTLALQHYYSSLEMHKGGKSYKSTINAMYYLDDNFDDNLYHFCAAVERYRINSGKIREKIDNLKNYLQEGADEFNPKYDLIV